MITLYTDGACSGNPGPGGWGVAVYKADGALVASGYGHSSETTNNQEELKAMIQALTWIIAHSWRLSGQQVTILTDSQYLVNGIQKWMGGWKAKGWKTAGKKPVANLELWQSLDQLLVEAKKSCTLHIEWVKAHNGEAGNEEADRLAVLAAKEQKTLPLRTWEKPKAKEIKAEEPIENTPTKEVGVSEEESVVLPVISELNSLEIRVKAPNSALAAAYGLAKERGVVGDLVLYYGETLQDEIDLRAHLLGESIPAESLDKLDKLTPGTNSAYRVAYIGFRPVVGSPKPETFFRQTLWVSGTDALNQLQAVLDGRSLKSMAAVHKSKKYLRTIAANNDMIRPVLIDWMDRVKVLEGAQYGIYDGAMVMRQSLFEKTFGSPLKGKAIARIMSNKGLMKGGLSVLPDFCFESNCDMIVFECKDVFTFPVLKPKEGLFWLAQFKGKEIADLHTDLQSAMNLLPVRDDRVSDLFARFVDAAKFDYKQRLVKLDGEGHKLLVAKKLLEAGIDTASVPVIHHAFMASHFDGMMDPTRLRICPKVIVTNKDKMQTRPMGLALYPTVAFDRCVGHGLTSQVLKISVPEGKDGVVNISAPTAFVERLKEAYGTTAAYAYRRPNDITSGTIVNFIAGVQSQGFYISATEEAYELLFIRNNGGDGDDEFAIWFGELGQLATEWHKRRQANMVWSAGRGSLKSEADADRFWTKVESLEAGAGGLGKVCGWNADYQDFQRGETKWRREIRILKKAQAEAIETLNLPVQNSWILNLQASISLDQSLAGMTGNAANILMFARACQLRLFGPTDKGAVSSWVQAIGEWFPYVMSVMISDIVDAELAGNDIERAFRSYGRLMTFTYWASWFMFQRGALSWGANRGSRELVASPIIFGNAKKTRLAGPLKKQFLGAVKGYQEMLVEDEKVKIADFTDPILTTTLISPEWELEAIFAEFSSWIIQEYNMEIMNAPEILKPASVACNDMLDRIDPALRAEVADTWTSLMAATKPIMDARHAILQMIPSWDDAALRVMRIFAPRVRAARRSVLATENDSLRRRRFIRLFASLWSRVDAHELQLDTEGMVGSKKMARAPQSDALIWEANIEPRELKALMAAYTGPDIEAAKVAEAALKKEIWFAALLFLTSQKREHAKLSLRMVYEKTLVLTAPEMKGAIGKPLSLLKSFDANGLTYAANFVSDRSPANVMIASAAKKHNPRAKYEEMLEQMYKVYGDWNIIDIQDAKDDKNGFAYLVLTLEAATTSKTKEV